MRYSQQTDADFPWIVTRMASGQSVTIELYDLATGSTVPLTSSASSEIGTTGFYRFDTSNIISPPAIDEYGQYLAVFTGGTTNEVTALKFTLNGAFAAMDARISVIRELIESQRGHHSYQGDIYYVDPANGSDSNDGLTKATAFQTIQFAINSATDSNHDVIILIAGAVGLTTADETITINKRYLFIRGPGRDFMIKPTAAGTDTVQITADGAELSGCRVETAATGTDNAINCTGNFPDLHHLWLANVRGHGIILDSTIFGFCCDNHLEDIGTGATGNGIDVRGTSPTTDILICNNHIEQCSGDGIVFAASANVNNHVIRGNDIHNNTGYGINIGTGAARNIIWNNIVKLNTAGQINDNGTNTIYKDAGYDVWDSVTSVHTTTGTFGKTVTSILTKVKTTIALILGKV